MTDSRKTACFAGDLERYQKEVGPLMRGEDLRKALGFPSATAFAQARRRGNLPVRTFLLENRRGCFCMTADVVAWLRTLQAPPPANQTQLTEEICP